MIFSILIIVLRVLAFFNRNRFPKTFTAHLVLFYLLGSFRFCLVAYFKLHQVEKGERDEMGSFLLKTAQEQLVTNLYAHVLFLAPTYQIAMIYVISFGPMQLFLTLTMLSSDHDGFIRSLVNAPMQIVGGTLGAYVL